MEFIKTPNSPISKVETYKYIMKVTFTNGWRITMKASEEPRCICFRIFDFRHRKYGGGDCLPHHLVNALFKQVANFK